MQALSELSNRCDVVVWSPILEDLRRLSWDYHFELSPGWSKESLSEDEDVIQEEERTWQDPSAHKMRVAVSSWTSDQVSRRKIVKVYHSSSGLPSFAETLNRCRSQVIGLILYLTTHNCLGRWESVRLLRRNITAISSHCFYRPFPTTIPPQRTTDAS